MTKRVIEHEVKLEPSVKIILAVFAFGVLAHLFAPALSINEALAELNGGGTASSPFYVDIDIKHMGSIGN